MWKILLNIINVLHAEVSETNNKPHDEITFPEQFDN